MEGGGHDSHDADADYQDQEGVEPGHGVRPWAQAFARTTRRPKDYKPAQRGGYPARAPGAP